MPWNLRDIFPAYFERDQPQGLGNMGSLGFGEQLIHGCGDFTNNNNQPTNNYPPVQIFGAHGTSTAGVNDDYDIALFVRTRNETDGAYGL